VAAYGLGHNTFGDWRRKRTEIENRYSTRASNERLKGEEEEEEEEEEEGKEEAEGGREEEEEAAAAEVEEDEKENKRNLNRKMCMTSNFVVTQKIEQSSPITVPPVRDQVRNKRETDWTATNRLDISVADKLRTEEVLHLSGNITDILGIVLEL
jgi:hypothetical protein